MTQTIVTLLLGAIPGYFIGQWRAEAGRARHEMRRAWRGRRDYRSNR